MTSKGGNKFTGFVKSLYNDPFRWQVVKSVSIFALGVYIAIEVANAEANPPQTA